MYVHLSTGLVLHHQYADLLQTSKLHLSVTALKLNLHVFAMYLLRPFQVEL